jgi:hypothetical protein
MKACHRAYHRYQHITAAAARTRRACMLGSLLVNIGSSRSSSRHIAHNGLVPFLWCRVLLPSLLFTRCGSLALLLHSSFALERWVGRVLSTTLPPAASHFVPPFILRLNARLRACLPRFVHTAAGVFVCSLLFAGRLYYVCSTLPYTYRASAGVCITDPKIPCL